MRGCRSRGNNAFRRKSVIYWRRDRISLINVRKTLAETAPARLFNKPVNIPFIILRLDIISDIYNKRTVIKLIIRGNIYFYAPEGGFIKNAAAETGGGITAVIAAIATADNIKTPIPAGSIILIILYICRGLFYAV